MIDVNTSLEKAAVLARAGAAAHENNDPASAAKDYGEAADFLAPALLRVLVSQASAWSEAGDLASARAAARRATAVDGDAALAWYWLGSVELQDGEPGKAQRAFTRAVEKENDLSTKSQYMDWVKKAERAVADKDGGTGIDISGGVAGVTASKAFEKDREEEDAQAAERQAPIMKLPATGPRMEWYQSADVVSVDLFVKNVDRAASVVEITEKRLFARLVRDGVDDYVMEWQLFDAVVPGQSRWSASKYKVEIKLKKTSSSQWKDLSAPGDTAADAGADAAGPMPPAPAKAKNWDAIADEQLKDVKDDDGPMALFKTIYAGADEDTQRAMMKSYQESGGKVLSTDWKDVGSRKVEWKDDDCKDK